jgi:hypothetical protein
VCFFGHEKIKLSHRVFLETITLVET